MASFQRLAGNGPSDEKPTRGNMNKQIKDLGLDMDDEERARIQARQAAEERKKKEDVNTPGSDAYLKRRQEDSERDLREAPRRR